MFKHQWTMNNYKGFGNQLGGELASVAGAHTVYN